MSLLQSTAHLWTAGTTDTLNFGAVSAGTTIIVPVVKYNADGANAITAANLTKSAGTATIGAVAKDASIDDVSIISLEKFNGAMLSFAVTGSGTLTMQLAGLGNGGTTGGGWALLNYAGTCAFQATGNNSGTGTGTTAATGSMAGTGPQIFVGAMTDYGGTNSAITPTAPSSATTIAENENGTSSARYNILAFSQGASLTSTCSWSKVESVQWIAIGGVYSDGAAANPSPTTGNACI